MNAAEQHPGRSGATAFLALVRRRRALVVIALALVPAAAVIFSLTQQKLYTSTAKVLLSRQNLANSLTGTPDATQQAAQVGDFARYAQTQASLATSVEVAGRVLTAMGLHDRTPQQLLDRTSVVPEDNTDILDFSVTDTNPARARQLANTYATQYTAYRLQLDTQSLQRAANEVGARIASLKRNRTPGLYQGLVESQQRLRTLQALQTGNATVVPTVAAASQVQPRLLRNGLLGLALGVMLAIGLAFLRETLDTRVRSVEETEQTLGAPLLARIPALPRRIRDSDVVLALAEPNSSWGESFRMLRSSLAFTRLAHEAQVIMITSSIEKEGKSTVAANLAVTLARAGHRVVVTDLDFRRPRLHKLFGIRLQPGASDVVLGESDLRGTLRNVALGDVDAPRPASPNGRGQLDGLLRVLPAGALPPNAGELVGTPALGRLLDRLREEGDTVIIDAPPLLHVGDAVALSPRVDGILMVVRLKVARHPELREASRLLATTPAPVLGFVITGEDEDDGYGYYGYQPRGEVEQGRRTAPEQVSN